MGPVNLKAMYPANPFDHLPVYLLFLEPLWASFYPSVPSFTPIYPSTIVSCASSLHCVSWKMNSIVNKPYCTLDSLPKLSLYVFLTEALLFPKLLPPLLLWLLNEKLMSFI